MDWFFEVIGKYADFSGRARRSEYWWFFLIQMILAFALFLADGILGFWIPQLGMGVLSAVMTAGLFVPSIAVTARRLHDVGLSGWWQLALFVPLAGLFVFLYFALRDSIPGRNDYGPNPKGVT